MQLDDEGIRRHLESAGLVRPGEPIAIEPAGDGNINFVRRVRAGDRTWVLKHARPALERFPEYRVTTERIVFEHRYGRWVAERLGDDARVLPREIHFDAQDRAIVMEDLGSGPRLDAELAGGGVPVDALRALGRFVGAVHRVSEPEAEALEPRFRNDEMRALHGEHIFTLPFEPNEFPIPDELRAEAGEALAREGARGRIAELRTAYYESREALVHADVQAGNVLLQGARPRLLDAEIAHVGDPAFDLGTALAHVYAHVALHPDRPAYRQGVGALLDGYAEGSARDPDPARGLGARARRYAGIELLRRTLGAARLPFLEGAAAGRLAVALGLDLLLS